jgi:hypothetical protein
MSQKGALAEEKSNSYEKFTLHKATQHIIDSLTLANPWRR